jgi:hypothetical protein
VIRRNRTSKKIREKRRSYKFKKIFVAKLGVG